MKNFRSLLLIILTSLLLPSLVNAQSSSYTTNSGLIIGFGAGSSFQVSDIKNSSGYGLDFRLGSYLYKKENAFLSVDWKFRVLAGSNKAYHHIENYDNTYSNIMLNHFNYDLELGLTLNRLRERTRIIATGYLGAGLTHGITYADLEDAAGAAYNYSVIDPTAARSSIVSDLKDLSDGDFESKQESKAAVLPTAGIFLGYQLSSSFALGLDYKVNFSLKENPGAFAINMDGISLEGSGIDMNHYFSVGFRWTLMNRSESAKRYRVNTTPAHITPPPAQRLSNEPVNKGPEVDITIPYRRIHTTSKRNVGITARIQRVSKKEDVTVSYNDDNTDFEFSAEERKIELPVYMHKDTNTLQITCKNEFGSASDDLILIYKESSTTTISRPATSLRVTTNTGNVNANVVRSDIRNETIVVNEAVRQTNVVRNTDVQQATVTSAKQPLVNIINPPSPLTVNKNIFNLKAQTTNVSRWEDIEVKINGKKLSNFNLTREGLISLNIALREGKNDIEVTGKNEAGEAADRTSLTYERIVNFPVIDDVKPVIDPVVIQTDTVNEIVDVVEIITPADTVIDIVDVVVVTPAIPEPEAVRINPGNSAWEFCLVTPSGKYNRENLENSDFRYTGAASKLFFKPIGGGGSAVVAGKKYTLRSGQYYLFSGSITVTVSNSNPGSMGHWSVMIVAGSAPTTGKGNNRPASPCASGSGNLRKIRKK